MKKTAEVLEGDDLGGGAFTLFLRPHPGAFRQLMCPHHGKFANFFFKKMLMHGVSPGGRGEEEWALLEMIDELFFFTITV